MKTFTFLLSMIFVVACLGTKTREEFLLPRIEKAWEQTINPLIVLGIDDADDAGVGQGVLLMVEEYRLDFNSRLYNDDLTDYDPMWMGEWVDRGIEEMFDGTPSDSEDVQLAKEELADTKDSFIEAVQKHAEK